MGATDVHSIEHHSSRRAFAALAAAFVLVLAGMAFAKTAGAEVVYDNIEPESLIENPASLGYAATGTTEFGSQITLNAESAASPEVEVLTSVWTCEQGEWNAGCVTSNPLATFAAPLTLNVYSVGPENEVGNLLTSATQTFNLRYRPTSDSTCSDTTKFKNANGVCNHGQPEAVLFKLSKTLPRKVILSVGFTPSGPTNDLNVGLEGPPSVGQNPLEAQEVVYWKTAWYPTMASATNVFEKHEGEEWTVGESQVAARVVVPTVAPPAPPAGTNGTDGTNGTAGTNGSGSNGNNGSNGSNEGSVALKRKMSLKFLSGKASVSGGKAAVKVRCLGSTARSCVGTLTLTVAGKADKVSYSVAAGKKATLKVALGTVDLSSTTTAAAVAVTKQSSGGATTAKHTLHLS
jgi:hypothetical protein